MNYESFSSACALFDRRLGLLRRLGGGEAQERETEGDQSMARQTLHGVGDGAPEAGRAGWIVHVVGRRSEKLHSKGVCVCYPEKIEKLPQDSQRRSRRDYGQFTLFHAACAVSVQLSVV